MTRWALPGGLAVVLAIAGALVVATPAAAQAPGVPPPGANDFSCRSPLNPVILVHGTFGDMTVSWNLFSPTLKNAGYCVFALDLVRRGMAPIGRSADKLAAFIDQVLARTGAARVSLVGHSQGGMLGRYVAKFRGKLGVIDDIVGLAPSSHGTRNPLAPRAGFFCPACVQQAAGSDLMARLNAPPEAPPPPSYTVVSTRHDEVVTPYRSQALAGATNVVLQDRCPEDITDHVGIVNDPIALQWTLNALARHGPADPAFAPVCSDALPGKLPFAFLARRRASLSDDGARVRVACMAMVGRCAGRVVVRDRAGRLGSARFNLAGGTKQTVHVPLRRAPSGRATGMVVTLQPGGYVKASLRLRRS